MVNSMVKISISAPLSIACVFFFLFLLLLSVISYLAMLWEHGQKLESNKTMTNLFLYYRNIFTEI